MVGLNGRHGNTLLKGVTLKMLILVSVVGCAAELRWDGEANDGLWQNPINWSSNTLPSNSDEVIFDNTFLTVSYVVILGPGTGLISIRSIRITPSGATTITVTIPVSNVETPALRCSGATYGLVLDPGAFFINESGASSGSTVEVTDSIRINNGGRYVHRTARSHAETVRSLSRATGTEEGEFEFSIPVASSTISLSGQVFGKLRLNPGPNGIINYTGTGINGLTVRSDFEIMPGVNLSLNLEGILLVGRHLLHSGGIFNLASTARKLTLQIGGNFRQSAAAITTESGTARPEIVLNGSTSQELEIKGSITNEVSLTITNPGGVILKHPLSLDYKLKLDNGILTTDQHLLTLQSSCLLEVAAGVSNCFVNGKLEKRGLSDASFNFPVGRGGSRRWLQLNQATGNFVVEYLRADPRAISTNFGQGISHISALEYWSIAGSSPTAAAMVELCFDNVNSGGITDLANLRVASLNGSSWQDAGNLATTGTPGSNGSVCSQKQHWLTSEPTLFTLASNTAGQNPLPIIWKSFRGFAVGEAISLEWIAETETVAYYQVEKSPDGSSFNFLDFVLPKIGSDSYSYTDRSSGRASGITQLYYRVVMVKYDSSRTPSKIIRVEPGRGSVLPGGTNLVSTAVFLNSSSLRLNFHDSRESQYAMRIIDIMGRIIFKGVVNVSGGKALVPLNLPGLRRVNHFIQLMDNSGNSFTLKVMVQ